VAGDGSVPLDASGDAAGAGSPAAGGSCPADGGTVARDASTGTDAGSSCQSRALYAISEQLALVSTAAAEGLLAISPTAATACIAAYQSSPCNGKQSTLPSVQDALAGCGGLFVGYIPVGERCDTTAECSTGSFCLAQGTSQNVTSIAGSSSLGVCFPYEETGQACNTSNDCDPSLGLVCSTATLRCELP
jgi:hypothetical protein